MKETILRSGNFILYVEKAAEFISGLRFDVGCTWNCVRSGPKFEN